MAEKSVPHEARSPVVLCVGETMALLTPSGDWPGDPMLRVHQAGAEANVACGLAHLGIRSRWASRLGDDEFAPVITGFLGSRGVDVASVVVDKSRPTGLMVKSVRDGRTTVRYARTGSAASAMTRGDLTAEARADVAVCHLSGVTPALSEHTSRLMDELVIDRALGAEVMISFDVNHRPVLWPPDTAPTRLRDLADAVDLVFVGLDEAETLWGCRTPEDVREVLPRPGRIVVKDGGTAAYELAEGRCLVVPALRAEVVEAVGAGDAFAAGYLAAEVSGADAQTRLRLGHVMAACTLQSELDTPSLPPSEALWRWARFGDDEWASLRFTPAVLGEGMDQ